MMQNNWIHGEGQAGPLMVIGEAPGEQEEFQRRPFVGPSGQELNKMLLTAGVYREECYVTNVIKVRPPDNKLHRLKELGYTIEDFIPTLWKEVESISPNCVLALGGTSLKALTGHTGITLYRGSILQSLHGYPKVIPTIHPAAIFERGVNKEGVGSSPWRQRAFIQFDINRAVQQSKFKEIRLPQRLLHVAKNSLDVARFLDRYKDYKRVTLDIESYKAIPMCIGLAFTRSEALSIPLTRILSNDDPEGIPSHDMAEIWRMIAALLGNPEIGKVGQNIKFDQGRLESIGFIIRNIVSDTMLKNHTIYPEFPKKLQVVASIFTEEPYYKDEGHFDITKGDLNKWFLYNAKDAAVECECDEEQEKEIEVLGLKDFYYNFVMSLNEFYYEIEKVGLKLDYEKRKELRKKYKVLDLENDKELEELAGRFIKVRSNSKDVPHLLFEELRLPRRKDVGEESLISLRSRCLEARYRIADHQKGAKAITLILKGRKIKQTISHYLMAKEDDDGRIRTQYNITGTETGRSSTSKIKPPVRADIAGLPFQTLTKHGDVGADLREMFVPDEGCIFVEPDLSQAEARIVALLARDERALEAFNSGRDIHKLTAQWIFGKEEVTEEERFIGKTARHAGNYGMGKHRFSLMANISEWKANKILEKFHFESPGIRLVFHQEIIQVLEDNSRVLITPFGRRRQFFERWSEKLFKEAYAYIPQSTVSDHLKMVAIRIKRLLPYTRYAIESHDSFTALIPKDKLHEFVTICRIELERPINFSKCSLPRGEITIPCEIKWSDTNLKEMRKYREEL